MLGQPPAPEQMRQYLGAYFGDGLPGAALDAVVAAGDGGIAAVRQRLERSYHQAWPVYPSSSFAVLPLTSLPSFSAPCTFAPAHQDNLWQEQALHNRQNHDVQSQLTDPVRQASMHAPGDASSSGRNGSAAASAEALSSKLEEGVAIRGLLLRNTEEMAGVLKALNGEYILPEAGGDLLRDGAGVLPTGARTCRQGQLGTSYSVSSTDRGPFLSCLCSQHPARSSTLPLAL